MTSEVFGSRENMLAETQQYCLFFPIESQETINKLRTLFLLSKPDTSPSPVTITKSHEKKCRNYFLMTTLPLTIVFYVVKMSILIRLITNLQREKKDK